MSKAPGNLVAGLRQLKGGKTKGTSVEGVSVRPLQTEGGKQMGSPLLIATNFHFLNRFARPYICIRTTALFEAGWRRSTCTISAESCRIEAGPSAAQGVLAGFNIPNGPLN